jgi:hypothetical protein
LTLKIKDHDIERTYQYN